ncbi:hypothetical protein [Catenuloplanes atrovinosus]|uniref:Uncharacterized protein n=1 Tax=Catenuloplanes atrovinosus TaxID=137266 RepID=A0AAE3YHY4_9ACTN|nr:hypothetical protein [Catenuloplanes atrovinosus]MDR7273755.1 hypothetical protein [Catenuloplanes atrovinosus]
MRWILSLPAIVGAACVAVAGAMAASPGIAGGAALAVSVLLIAHPAVARVPDAASRVLLRGVAGFVGAAVVLRVSEWWRWRSPDRAPEDLGPHRAEYAADLLTVGCLAVAVVCAGVVIGRSWRGRRVPVAVAMAGVFLLAGAAWRAVVAARVSGELLRARESAAELARGGAFVQEGLRYSRTAMVAIEVWPAVLVGAMLLGAVLAVAAGARLAAAERR